MVVIPKLTAALEHDIVSSIIDAVGRTVTIRYTDNRGVCPVCGGTNPFCATCYGNPTVDTIVASGILASVKWKSTDQKKYTPVGQFIEGDCLVKFAVDLENYEVVDALLKSALSMEVDGRVCVIDKWYFGGSPINRVAVILNIDESTSGQRIG